MPGTHAFSARSRGHVDSDGGERPLPERLDLKNAAIGVVHLDSLEGGIDPASDEGQSIT